MFSNFDSDLLTHVVLWASLTITAIVIAIVCWTATLRLQGKFIGVHESHFLRSWRPLLLETVDAVPTQLPKVRKRDWFVFLALWNQFHDSLRGPARHRLNAVALRLRMDSAARNLLATRDTENQLVAVMTLGHLGDQDSWNILETVARSRTPILSLAALRALFQTNASRAMAIMLSSIGARDDWPTGQLEKILAEADSTAVSEGLIQAAEIAIPSELPRLVSLMDAAHPAAATPYLLRLVQSSKDEEILIACLKSRHAPKNLDAIAPFMDHTSWQVRTQIARLLGGAISPGEEHLLISLLADKVWWVRYRAGQSLTQLPFLSQDALWKLRFSLTDEFAKDILDQVVAEMKIK
ncbi:MAG TPA: hypothetical protein VMW70_13825 [Burkholderiales bacterium]|nr:hypothetical protein [Burkholderiales bacterium]